MNEHEQLESAIRAYAPSNDANVLRRNITSVIDKIEMERNTNGQHTIYELLINWGEEGQMSVNVKGPTTWVIRVPSYETEVESGQLSGFAGHDEGIAQMKQKLDERGWAVKSWAGYSMTGGNSLVHVYRTRPFDRD